MEEAASRASETCRQEAEDKSNLGLPCWSSGWESTCQCRGHELHPWDRKISHAVGQRSLRTATTQPGLWSPWTTTTEDHVPRSVPPREKPPQPETCSWRWKRRPPLSTAGDSPVKTQWRHSAAINKEIFTKGRKKAVWLSLSCWGTIVPPQAGWWIRHLFSEDSKNVRSLDCESSWCSWGDRSGTPTSGLTVCMQIECWLQRPSGLFPPLVPRTLATRRSASWHEIPPLFPGGSNLS